MTDRHAPPQDNVAEQALLGSALLSDEIARKMRATVTPDLFYRDAHREIYQAISDLVETSEPIDLLTVTTKLRNAGKLEDVGGTVYLATLPDATPTPENWEFYATTVREKARHRQILRLGQKAVSLGHHDGTTADEALIEILAMAREIRSGISRTAPRSIGDLLSDYVEEKDRILKSPPGTTVGVPMGLPCLDRLIGGGRPGDIILISGVTGGGKSVLLGQMWAAAGMQRGPALLCSNEMTSLEYLDRLFARTAKIDLSRLRDARALDDDDWRRLTRQMDVMHGKYANRLYVQPEVFDPARLRQGIDHVLDEAGSLVWVGLDWLQLMRAMRRSDTRTLELGTIMSEIKEMALEFGIPIAIVSQWNLNATRDGKASLGNVKDSGAIEQTANISIMLEDVVADPVQGQAAPDGMDFVRLVITKNRNSPRAAFDLAFRGSFMEFSEVENRRTA